MGRLILIVAALVGLGSAVVFAQGGNLGGACKADLICQVAELISGGPISGTSGDFSDTVTITISDGGTDALAFGTCGTRLEFGCSATSFLTADTTLIYAGQPVAAAGGNVTFPAFSFTEDTGLTGMYRNASHSISWASNGARVATLNGSIFQTLQHNAVVDGSEAEPAVGFTSDDDGSGTGLYRSAANALSVTANGTTRLTINASNMTRVAGDWVAGAGEISTTNAVNVSGAAALYNSSSGEPLVLSDVDGYELRVRTPLPTCGDGSGDTTVPPGTVYMLAGSGTVPTKFCVCRLTPTGSVYAWDNVFSTTANALRSTTNCSD